MISPTDPLCDIVEYPNWYVWAMHSLALISTPANLFCAFIIIKHSTKRMRIYKRHLIAFHIASSSLDIVFSSGVIPVIIFPFSMGYAAGFLRMIGGFWLTHLTMMMVVFTLVNVMLLFFYRLQVVLPANHMLYFKTSSYRLIVAILFFVNLAPMAAMVLIMDTKFEITRNDYAKNFSCLRHIIMREDLFIFDFHLDDVFYYVLFMCVSVSCSFIFITCCIAISFFHLNNSPKISVQTRKLQKKLMFQLICQVILPFSVMMLPVLAYFSILYWRIPRTQTIGNVIFILCACHGTVSSMSILYLNDKYRQVTFEYFIYPACLCLFGRNSPILKCLCHTRRIKQGNAMSKTQNSFTLQTNSNERLFASRSVALADIRPDVEITAIM